MRNTGLYLSKDNTTFTVRAAALIVRDGKLLMAKSSDHPCYYTVGGVVELGESSAEAVVREVREETGCMLDIDRLAYVQERFFTVSGHKYHELVFFYQMRDSTALTIADGDFTDQPPKETLHWLPIRDLPSLNIVPECLKTWGLDGFDGPVHIVTREG